MLWGYHTIFPPAYSPPHPIDADNDYAADNSADDNAADDNATDDDADDNANVDADNNNTTLMTYDNADGTQRRQWTMTQMTDNDADDDTATQATDNNADNKDAATDVDAATKTTR